jgi:hypothetical protein
MQNVNCKQNNSRIAKKINSLQINENMEETALEQAILKLCELLRETATLTSSAKTNRN